MAAWKLPLSLILAVLIGTVGLADDDHGDDDAEEPIEPWVKQVASEMETIRPSKTDRDNLEKQLELDIELLSVTCDLSAGQKNKLRFAGRMEIKRLFDQIESGVRRVCQQKTLPACRLAFQDVAPLLNVAKSNSTIQMFLKDSLVHKVATTVLSPEQLQKFRAAIEAHRQIDPQDGGLGLDRRKLIPPP